MTAPAMCCVLQKIYAVSKRVNDGYPLDLSRECAYRVKSPAEKENWEDYKIHDRREIV